MAVKGVVTVTGTYFDPASAGDYRIQLVGAGLDAGNPVNFSLFLAGISPSLVASVLDAAIKTAVKNELTANHGYTFGLFDTVQILPGVI